MSGESIARARIERAFAISRAGGLDAAISSGAIPVRIDATLAELIVLGLLRQNVSRYVTVLGHGSTELGEVLRIYESAGLLRTFGVRSEVEASHAAAALRWVTGEKAAVVTSIGPGALQALAASIAPASDGLGVWYLFGDETTQDEGPNMQQIPREEQGLFTRLCATMGDAYSLHTPWALATALRRGLARVDDPHSPGPFYLLMPLNTQPAELRGFHLDELPCGAPPKLGASQDEVAYGEAVSVLRTASRVTLKIGAGARFAGDSIARFLDLTHAVAALSPRSTGAIAFAHPRNMQVGGSKGSISGNFAMEQADLVVVLGSRAVCQSDCSRTGYLNARHVININTDARAAMHYSRTTALVGDAGPTLDRLCDLLEADPIPRTQERAAWLDACAARRAEWEAFKRARYDAPTLHDGVWNEPVLTQPAAIKLITDLARERGAITFFDAGDVQANGFQLVEDDRPGRTFTETGASYMGFATSALLATALSKKVPYSIVLTGDGSFTMNPQALSDGVQHGARGCVVVLDNRRMAAISGLQWAQYGHDHATNDRVAVDYVAWGAAIGGVRAIFGGKTPDELRRALDEAFAFDGVSLVHVPVYCGANELGGLGAFGRWNVGNWVEDTQRLRHELGL
ncbi:MAG: thiamine pyrophosphate-binding protein [Deltaproteobacteria bacterium]|nr:thiamine pyrophosphate-binding protein [Deltaproteobacteria bacterium]